MFKFVEGFYMLKNITSGVKKAASGVGKILFLFIICLVLGLGIVFPLWKWADSSPKSYTWAILCVLLAGIIFLFIRSFKKKGGFNFTFGILKLITILGGLTLCVYFVLKSNRIMSLVVFVMMFVLYGILVAIKSRIKEKTNSKN